MYISKNSYNCYMYSESTVGDTCILDIESEVYLSSESILLEILKC